jgi:hypothetical protein
METADATRLGKRVSTRIAHSIGIAADHFGRGRTRRTHASSALHGRATPKTEEHE